MSGSVVQASLRMGMARALRLRALLVGGGVVTFAAAVALAEKNVELLGSATRSLQGGAFGFLIPLTTFGAVGIVLRHGRLDDAAAPLARFGASRRAVALGLVSSAMLTSAVLATALASVTALLANDPFAPPLADDVAASAWIGALTGAAYAAFFALGSTFGRRGGGRSLALLLDFTLGGAVGLLGALTPRAHALNLLGAPPPLETLSQAASASVLIAMTLAAAGLAIFRCAR